MLHYLRSAIIFTLLFFVTAKAYCWGFFGHRFINYHAVFLLPPAMIKFYKINIEYLREHSVDPDKRRYMIDVEGPRHYIDLDRYGAHPFTDLPRSWNAAVEKFSEDTLIAHGTAPWWIQIMLQRLTNAFSEKKTASILKLSAELGHYIADIHVPLHTSSNHNGQHTNQHGIHGFWESRIPELLAEKEWDFYIGTAIYIDDPSKFIWARALESAAASDSVLRIEKTLSQTFKSDLKYAFENRNGQLLKQYSTAYTLTYNQKLNNMVERRMRESISAVASFWYTAWLNAGQPNLNNLLPSGPDSDSAGMKALNAGWKAGKTILRNCE